MGTPFVVTTMFVIRRSTGRANYAPLPKDEWPAIGGGPNLLFTEAHI